MDGRKTTVWSAIAAVLGAGASAVAILQFFLPAERADAFEKGKQEIAQAVVQQLRDGGVDTKLAETALAEGNGSEAIALATKAVLAKEVAVAPKVPFVLKEREVIDLPTGGMLSFTTVSVGAKADIRLKIDDVTSNDMRIGESFPLPPDQACKLDFLDAERADSVTWQASFRIRC